MRMRHVSGGIFALILSCGLATSPAAAGERDATAAESAKVRKHLQALGYSRIIDIDVVGDRFVVDARSPQGRDVDVHLDVKTLAVVKAQRS
jgi:hypothetical protein